MSERHAVWGLGSSTRHQGHYLFLKSSTTSCMLRSSTSRRPPSICSASSCCLSPAIWASKMRGSWLLLADFCSCSSAHLVSSILFCCSRKRTWRGVEEEAPEGPDYTGTDVEKSGTAVQQSLCARQLVSSSHPLISRTLLQV